MTATQQTELLAWHRFMRRSGIAIAVVCATIGAVVVLGTLLYFQTHAALFASNQSGVEAYAGLAMSEISEPAIFFVCQAALLWGWIALVQRPNQLRYALLAAGLIAVSVETICFGPHWRAIATIPLAGGQFVFLVYAMILLRSMKRQGA